MIAFLHHQHQAQQVQLKLEIESTIAALENSVDLSKEEIEKIAAEVLEEESKKRNF